MSDSYFNYIMDYEAREKEDKEMDELYKSKTSFSFGEIIATYNNNNVEVCPCCNGNGVIKKVKDNNVKYI